jgi:hypothetical protein
MQIKPVPSPDNRHQIRQKGMTVHFDFDRNKPFFPKVLVIFSGTVT